MTGRRAIVGLSLFCALLLGAFAGQGASAASTLFTCAPAEGGGAGFSDAHCDKPVGTSAKFKHVEIAAGTATFIHATNKQTANETKEATPAILTAKEFHGFAEVVITCTEVTSNGVQAENFLKNIAGPPMSSEGKVALHYNSAGGNCTTNVKNVTAAVATVKAKFKPFENGNEMGIRFEPAVAGDPFAAITFVGGALNGEVANVTGSFVGTSRLGAEAEPGGATLVVTPAMSSLKLGESKAELSQTTTTVMTTGTTTENAITTTTTTT
jgi:hypothetical protein